MMNWQLIAKRGYIRISNKLECQTNCVEGHIELLPCYISYGNPPKLYLRSIRYKYYFRFTVDKKDYLDCNKYLYNRSYVFDLITNEYVLQNCLVNQIVDRATTSIQFVGTCLNFKKINVLNIQ